MFNNKDCIQIIKGLTLSEAEVFLDANKLAV